MTTTPINPLRRGSAGYEAIEAVRRHGPMSGTAIAVEIEKPADEIDQLLRFPVREGLLRIDADGLYHLGEGKKLEIPAAPAPAPVPAAAPVISPAPSPAAAPPAQTEQQLRSKVSRRFQMPPTVTAPVMAPLVTETEAQIRARNNAAQKQALESAIIERQVSTTAAAPAAPAADAAPASAPAPRLVERPPFIAAYCSDGTYVIEQGTNRIELDLAETQVLFEHMAQVARVAA